MIRKDFLLSILIAVVCLKMFISRAEYWELFVYMNIFLVPAYSLIAWLGDIQLRSLKTRCRIGDKYFSEKYKYLDKYL